MSSVHAIAFDAYGTLFNVYSIGALAEKLFPSRGSALAELWRDKQIEYTRLRTLSSMYRPFWEVTRDALAFACRKLDLELSPEASDLLMAQYARLDPFPENRRVLQELRTMGVKLAILSNGTDGMLDTAVAAAGMEGLFDHVLSVDRVRKFKTAPEAYQLGPKAFGTGPEKILFVSSNGWDVCGAAWFGYRTFWVNRGGGPLEELGVAPDATGNDLNDLLKFVQTNRSST